MLRQCVYVITASLVIASSFETGYAQERANSPAAGQRQQQPSQQTTPRQPQGLANEMTPESFVKHVVESNQKEIDMAKLATTRAASADVKSFATQLVTDHTKALSAAKAYASKKSIALASTTNTSMSTTSSQQRDARSQTNQTTGRAEDRTQRTGTQTGTDTATRTETRPAARAGDPGEPDHSAHMKDLSAKSGTEFDKAFMMMMVEGHEKSVALFERQSQAKLGDQELQRFINDTLPTLRRHLTRSREINNKVAGGTHSRIPGR
jgi:putative membrane protein